MRLQFGPFSLFCGVGNGVEFKMGFCVWVWGNSLTFFHDFYTRLSRAFSLKNSERWLLNDYFYFFLNNCLALVQGLKKNDLDLISNGASVTEGTGVLPADTLEVFCGRRV